MNRRAFLASLGIGAAAIALDPELLLWKPGARSIFLPTPAPSLVTSVGLTIGDVFTIDGLYAINPVTGRGTGYLQNYIITATTEAGEISPAIVCPRIVTSGEYQNVQGVLTPKQRIRPVTCGPVIPSTVTWMEG